MMRAVLNAKNNFDPELQPAPAETLGQYIRRVCLIRGVKLSDFSRATARFGAQVSEIHLSHFELDMVPNRSIEHLTSLAMVLNIPPQGLIEKSEMSGTAVKHGAQEDLQDGARLVTFDANEQEMILAMIEEVLRRHKVGKRRKQQ